MKRGPGSNQHQDKLGRNPAAQQVSQQQLDVARAALRTWEDEDAWDNSGFHESTGDMYDADGYNELGFHRHTKLHAETGGRHDRYGYDMYGFDRDGYDCGGFNRDGYNREGIHRSVR